jgi:hypothetical protein
VLEVVQHQQQVQFAQVLDKRRERRLRRRVAHAQGSGHGVHHQSCLAHGRQLDQAHARCETVRAARRGFDRQPGFARTAGASQRQ